MSAREYVLNIARPRPVRRAAVIVSMLALLGAVLLVWFEDHLSGSIGTELASFSAGCHRQRPLIEMRSRVGVVSR